MSLEIIKEIYNTNCNRSNSDIAGHLPLLYEMCVAKKPKVVIQAGIRGGDSDSAFALAAIEQGFILEDVDIQEVGNDSIKTVREQTENWNFTKTRTDDSTYVDYLQQYKGKVDIFFTDTSHNYPDTKFELDNYSKLLSDTGIIMIHDMDPWTHFPDQSRAVDEFLVDNPEFKVKVQLGNNGMATLYRKKSHLNGVVCDNDTGIGTHTI